MDAFQFITRSLSLSTQGSPRFRQRLAVSPPVWEEVAWIANHYQVPTLLWSSLKRKQLLHQLPDDFESYLRELSGLNAERNRRLKEQLEEMLRAFNGIGVAPVLLKGAAHLVRNRLYEDPAERIMSDLDILVEEANFSNCVDTLHSLGYENDPALVEKYRDKHHWAPFYRPGVYGAIELHRAPLPQRLADCLPTGGALASSTPETLDGMNYRVLAPGQQVLHAILHAELMDRAYWRGNIDLRTAYETARTVLTGNGTVDWPTLRTAVSRSGYTHILDAHLYMAHRLFARDLALPDLAALRPRFHYYRARLLLRYPLLRRLQWKIRRPGPKPHAARN